MQHRFRNLMLVSSMISLFAVVVPSVSGNFASASAAPRTLAPQGNVGICHRTGDPTNPLVYIEVSQNALPAHQNHGDIIGAPHRAFCETVLTPTVTRTNTPTTTPTRTPTNTPTTTSTHTPTTTSTRTPTNTPTTTSTHTPTPTNAPTAVPSGCSRPLRRALATQGGGTAGATQGSFHGAAIQSVVVDLVGATPNTAFDVYIDQNSLGTRESHIFAGSFTTDASGNALFRGGTFAPTFALVVDIEIVLAGHSTGAHQYTQQSFVPCG